MGLNTEEKEEKPKKLFTITIDVYDSGDSDSSMVEYRKSASGLGRPRKWELTPGDFVRRVEETLGDYSSLLSDWNNLIGKSSKELAGLTLASLAASSAIASSNTIKTVQVKQGSQDNVETKKSKTKRNQNESESESDMTEDMDFGSFDKPTE